MAAPLEVLSLPTTLSAGEQALYREWQQRVARARAGDAAALPDGVRLGVLAVMGRSGDEQVAYPVLALPSALERTAPDPALPLDVAFAGRLAERLAAAASRRGPIIAGEPASGAMRHITPEEVTKHTTTFVLIPRVGG